MNVQSVMLLGNFCAAINGVTTDAISYWLVLSSDVRLKLRCQVRFVETSPFFSFRLQASEVSEADFRKARYV